MNQFPASTRYYTQYKGTRCALPLLADVYGFYYNKELFKKAGLTRPPKTMEELTAYAKKLTVKNADGSLKVVGYDPEFGFYQNTSGAYQPLFGAKWFDKDGKSSLSTDPAWKRLLTWQKSLVDFYGTTNSSSGRQAQVTSSPPRTPSRRQARDDDGRRVARVVHRLGAPRPRVRHGADARRRSARESLRRRLHQRHHHRDSEERQEQGRGLGSRQVPDDGRSRAREVLERDQERPLDPTSSKSPELKPDANFAVFSKIFVNPNSTTTPITSAGAAYLDTFQSFLAKWQSGKAKLG